MKKILLPIFAFILFACSTNAPAPTATLIPPTQTATLTPTLTVIPTSAPEAVAPAENGYMKMPMVLEAKDFSKAPEIDPNNKEQMKQISEAVMARYNAGEFNQISPDAVPFKLDYTQEVYGADGMMQILSPTNKKDYQNPKLDPQVSGPIFRDKKGNGFIVMFVKQQNGEVGLMWDFIGRNGSVFGKFTYNQNEMLNLSIQTLPNSIKLPFNFKNTDACVSHNRGLSDFCGTYDIDQLILTEAFENWKQSGLIPSIFSNGDVMLQWGGKPR